VGVVAVHTGGGSILEEKKPTHSSLYRDGLLGAKVEICPRGRSAGGDLAVVRTGVRRLYATDTTSRTGIAGTFVGGTLKYAANNSD
jgi:hypothetical protein